MTWENIEAVGKVAADGTPPMGVRVNTRSLVGGQRWIAIVVGKDLAKASAFHMEKQKVRVLFGTGVDAGKIAVAVDQSGDFVATRRRSGEYLISINGKSAKGRFCLNFPAFRVETCEAIKPQNGQPPKFIFRVSREMLDAEG